MAFYHSKTLYSDKWCFYNWKYVLAAKGKVNGIIDFINAIAYLTRFSEYDRFIEL